MIHVGINLHYSNVMMGVMAAQITAVSIVCLTVCSGAYQRKHQSAPRPLWGLSTGDRQFQFDDVIMHVGTEQRPRMTLFCDMDEPSTPSWVALASQATFPIGIACESRD